MPEISFERANTIWKKKSLFKTSVSSTFKAINKDKI